MPQAPSNLIPTRITQLQEDPAPSNQGYLVYVRDGVTYKVKAFDILNITGVPNSRNVLAGTGMTGGGPLSTDVTLSIAPGGVDGTQLANTGVTPGVYGSNNEVPQFTVDAKGRVTVAALIPISGTGLGSVSSVQASGGTTGMSFSGGPITTYGTLTMSGTLAVANGGTGATSAASALTSLGAVGSIASADGSVTLTRVGSAVDLSVLVSGSTTTLISQVRNQTGATLLKGTVVYISGASGNKALVSKAIATGDSTSAQTYGMVNANIDNNQNGYVTVVGIVAGLDTSAFADGTQLYLSTTTAGTFTATKVYAPGHLVYVGVVTRQHVNQGEIQVKIQNGYEMDELHNVSAQTPSNGQTLVYNTTTSLWENNTVPLATGVSGTLGLANGGTGATTRQTALNALAGAVTATQYLRGDGTNLSMSAIQAGDVPTLNQNTTGNATTATRATNLAGGVASQLPYQTGANTTAFIANGTAGQVLTSAGAAVPTWGSISGGTF